MKLNILSIKERGNLDKEHILLKSSSLIDLSHYVIIYTKKVDEEKVNTGTKICHWFSPTNLKSGDFVRLYTKIGTESSFSNKAGTKTYEFYLDLETSSFQTSDDAAVLIEMNQWDTKA